MIKVLFFDAGFTLVDESAVWERRCQEQAATEEAKKLGLTASDIYREIERASAARLPQFKTVVKKFGFSKTAPYRHELETLYPDAPAVLGTLSEKYPLGVIANQAEGLCQRLRDFGIRQFFTYVVSSWDVGVSKPDSRIFEYALKLAKCAPHEAVMIGDRLDNDIAPAKALGMKTVWIKKGFGRSQTPLLGEMPGYTVDSLTELLGIF